MNLPSYWKPKRLALLSFLSISLQNICAQPGKTLYFSKEIKTLQLKVDGHVENFPVLKQGEGETLEVSFDDLTHEYKRYSYKVVHCDPEGHDTPDLFESDYFYETTDENVIDNYENSQNTTVLYTHYRFSLPNTQVAPKLPGNYRISIYGEDEEGESHEMCRTYFAVSSSQVGIKASCSTNTDVDWNATHQQITLEVNCGNLVLRDATSEIKLIVLQNRRWDQAVIAPTFTTQNGNTLLWEHQRQLIFDAGNEYRKMEILSTRYPGMHGDGVRWHELYYHYTLMPDYPRRNYLYDEDRNGLYVTRWESAGDADVEADYVLTHFELESEKQEGCEVFICGQWTGGILQPDFQMTYDEQRGKYTADVLLKSGYYNYLYLCSDAKQPLRGDTAPFEGNYYQTENEYDFLVYYKPTGSRYWQLVGCTTPIYKK